MRGSAPPGTAGYVVVSLPDSGEWQGFFVIPAYAGAGTRLLREAEAQVALSGGSEVVSGIPGSGADQRVVGVVSAVLADYFSRGVARPQPPASEAAAIMAGVGASAWALAHVSGEPWLLVTGRPDPGRGGMATTVMPVKAGNVDEAREALVAEVAGAKKADALRDAVLGMFRTAAGRRPEEGRRGKP